MAMLECMISERDVSPIGVAVAGAWAAPPAGGLAGQGSGT
jgi:hypothetical protein